MMTFAWQIVSARAKRGGTLLRAVLMGASLVISTAVPPVAEAQTAPPPDHVISDYFPGPWTILFDRNSSKIDPGLSDYLDRILEADLVLGHVKLLIKGHASSVEKAGVAARRAAAVRDYLVRRGLRRAQMKVVDAGTSEPRRPGGTAAENQRVVVTTLAE
ncbi:outer membrane protein OmpA-like peptidoglycan-associated protein [Sphingomonas jinjuensis]|uniref:Outer membrane protein OmpA-like peptidoglycan-associated protein n=1 Tax=Sphingomonas jinjuensis TaxID=535907 RepID=A0A840FQZ3_9SPHN|nr:OmpA family protein [Sphingomonas jinjuensis]MBB4155685.1 outer membrane protein OmpA-like peptidoglycan-associated protein [Sphingomonas jinjuensis]